jgi:predicted nucleic acid-binding protein
VEAFVRYTHVLDSWPVMEWLQQREPTTTHMDDLIERALRGEARVAVSRINFGEILYSCWKLDVKHAAQLRADFETLPFDVLSVDDDLVVEAAEIKAWVSASYADCFAAALALRFDVPVITGDDEFAKMLALHPKLKLEWVGK